MNNLLRFTNFSSLLLFFTLGTLASHPAQATTHYNQCDICVNGDAGDPGPRETLLECKTWFRTVKNRGDFTKIVAVSSVKPELMLSDVTCDQVSLWGSFHANEEFSPIPFDVSSSVASIVQAKAVDYTGSSCDIFHDVDSLTKNAQELIDQNPNTTFTIAGNQNMGWVDRSLFKGWHEPSKNGSKAIVTIANGKVNLGYQACSTVQSTCILDLNDDETDVVQTSKLCSGDDGKTHVQSCCEAGLSRKQSKHGLYDGLWSDLDGACASDALPAFMTDTTSTN